MNIKELNMVDWTEAETARKEDDKPKADHRTTPQYIAYLNKSAKRKDSTSTSNIIEELNEEGWGGYSGNDDNAIDEQNDAMVEALQSRISVVIMQCEYNGSDAFTNCILFGKVWSDKDIKIPKFPEEWVNPSPAANKD